MNKIITISALLSFFVFGCISNRNHSSGIAKNQPLKYILVNGVKPTTESFREVDSVFGKTTNNQIAVGIGFIISYLNMKPEDAAAQLKTYLSLSEKHDLPVVIQLDGEQWWGKRPDLWNWWDKTKPGYDLENRNNVEWSAWTPDSAVKLGWRNWGRQLRVLPMPNLMSHAYREACHNEMGKLIPIIVNWWNRLPREKKYLLVGVKMGWESAIGVNNWYYPDGNKLLNQPEKNDPAYGLKADSIPDRGVKSIGYASISTLGLANSGMLKEEHLTKVVQLHLEDLCKFAAGLGVPRDHLFTHCGGWSQGEALYTAAVNEFSCPGWSFYKYAIDPRSDTTAMKALEKSDAPYWGAVEWLYLGDHNKAEWISALTNTLSTNRARYLCIYNWASIKNNPDCISAVKEIIQKQ